MPQGTAGAPSGILGKYLVKITIPGALSTPGAASTLSPDRLRDVILRVGYRLATPA